MKFWFPLLLGISLSLCGCKTPVSPAKPVVIVNGTPIREQQIIDEADKRINAEAAQSAMNGLIYDESERPITRAVIRDDVLHTLIERQLIADQLETDRIEITDAEVDAHFLAKAAQRGLNREQAEAEIKEQGKTLADVQERIRWHTLGVQKLYEKHAQNKKTLTDDAARQVYNENPGLYFQEHERRVSRILFNAPDHAKPSTKKAARAKAEAALKRIQAGEDFAAVAKDCSEDGATRLRGGDRGWSPRGFVTKPGSDSFGDIAFAMTNVGDITGVVQTQDGYEIIKLTGIKEARQKAFDEVKAEIIGRDRHWEIGNFWEQYAAQLREKARIQWDPAEQTRRATKEVRDRKFNQKIERQIARQEQRAKQKNRDPEKGHAPRLRTATSLPSSEPPPGSVQ